MNKGFLIKGLSLILFAIILGAFGAHLLKGYLNESQLGSFEVGVRYQMFTGIIISLFAFNFDKIKGKIKWRLNLLFYGNILFSVSIYLINLLNAYPSFKKVLGPITPLGGLMMIISVLSFIILLMVKNKPEK